MSNANSRQNFVIQVFWVNRSQNHLFDVSWPVASSIQMIITYFARFTKHLYWKVGPLTRPSVRLIWANHGQLRYALKSVTLLATALLIELLLKLLLVAKSFVLRRDTSLLKNHLPPKCAMIIPVLVSETQKKLPSLAEFVVFITPTPLQLEMFSKILNPKRLDDLIQSSTAESLALINILTKISNSPILLKATADSIKSKSGSLPSMQQASVVEALNLLPDNAHIADVALSGGLILSYPYMFSSLMINTQGKLVVLSKILRTLRQVRFFSDFLSSNLQIHFIEHIREMRPCFSLYLDFEHPWGVLQKNVVFLFSFGWVSNVPLENDHIQTYYFIGKRLRTNDKNTSMHSTREINTIAVRARTSILSPTDKNI